MCPSALSALAVLDALEKSVGRAQVDRAPVILAALGLLADGVTVESLTVGQCDAALYRLRRELFGDRLELIATCPSCETDVEVDLSVTEIESALREPEMMEGEFSAGGLDVRFRLARNEDLSAMATALDPLEELMRRCIVSIAASEGREVVPDVIPLEIGNALADKMAAADPAASVELSILCGCGSAWSDELDIRSVVWSDVTDWAGRAMSDVHILASEYGWSESEILALPSWRRRWYVEAVGE